MHAPCDHQGDLESVAAQHRNYINIHNIKTLDPIGFFWDSLGEHLEVWMEDGEEIIVLRDFNKDVESQAMKEFFERFNVTERVVEMVECGPETFKGNQSGKTIDGT